MSELVAVVGTKAQYIKTAPVLRRLTELGITYRLVDTGQHADLTRRLRGELGLREPDVRLGGGGDVTSLPQAMAWAARVLTMTARPRRLRSEVLGGDARLCIVHGDTPSTLIATLLARRAGVRVAHLEAGLRSRSLWHPFPEELIRLLVMRRADLLFAPDDAAETNLAELRVRGRVVRVPGNTSLDALRWTGGRMETAPGSGHAIVAIHRVENLHRSAALRGAVELATRLAATMPTRFVLHGPTARALARRGLDVRLADAGVELGPLVPHHEFVTALGAAPLVVTDGGSVQEECARLGVPTLLWRARTERSDGLGASVVLSRYEGAIVDDFLADPSRWRRPARLDESPSPAAAIVEGLIDELDRDRL